MNPIVRNIKNDHFYKHLGGNEFLNIATGVAGKVTDAAARNTFKINLEATTMFHEYPLVEELIKALNLKCGKEENKNNTDLI